MSEENEKNTPSAIPWYFKKGSVFISLFLVLGPLGFPLLFKSPAFTFHEKIFYTLLVTLLTVLALGGMGYIFMIIYRHYQEVFKVIDSI